MLPEPEITILFVARHGETGLNAANCFRGNKDIPLNEKGLRQAHNLKKLFEDMPLSFVVSSDRQRATKTAQIIHEGKNIPLETTETLRALNVGDFSGLERTPENTAGLQHYLDRPHIDIPGGESLDAFRGRIDPAIWEAFEIADDSGLPGLVVAHSSVIHELSFLYAGKHDAVLVEPGGVVAVYVHDGKIQIQAVHRPMVPPPTGRADTVS